MFGQRGSRLRFDAGRQPERAARAGPLAVQRYIRFGLTHGRLGRLNAPATFSEKVNWRILHDRRELLRPTCDKLQTKQQALRLGISSPPTLWHGADLADLIDRTLPPRWVLKPNNGSGHVVFGAGPVTDVHRLQSTTAGWLRDTPARQGEWAYAHARPLFVVEEMLTTDGRPPTSYKFFVFDGVVRAIAVITVESASFATWRIGDHWPPPGTARRFYSPAWHPLDVRVGDLPVAAPTPPPAEIGALLDAAAAIGAPYDFMRVDLFAVAGQIYFSELTPYPSGGLARFTPRAYDRELGAHWTLPDL